MKKTLIIKKILSKIFRRIYKNNHLIIFFLLDFIGEESKRVISINDKYNAITNKELKEKVYKEIQSGSIVYGVFVGEELAHFSCVSKKRRYVGEIERDLIIENSDFYIYNCFTEASFRGLGLYGETLNHILYMNKGTRAIIACLEENKPSLKVINKIGFRSLGGVHFLKIIGFGHLVNKTEFTFVSR